MKKLLLFSLAIITILSLVACEKNEDINPTPVDTQIEENTNNETNTSTVENNEIIESNVPLKEDVYFAESKIMDVLEDYIKQTFGEEVEECNVYVQKIYTAEDEQESEVLKGYNLSNNEVAFEAKYEIKIAEGADANKFLAGSGTLDEESRWVSEKYGVGVLRASEGQKYVITDFGTGW